MPVTSSVPPLAPDAAGRLAAFARACKAAARAVSLYPVEHPAIENSLARLAATAAGVTERGPYTMLVVPGRLLVDGRACSRPDPSIAELANLLHDHMVGQLTISPKVNIASWRAFLTLLSLDPQDVRAQGGIERAWTTGGGHGIEMKEIDYASLIQERESGDGLTWESIIASCLRSDALELDEATLRALTEIAHDPERLSDFLTRLEEQGAGRGDVRTRSDALMRILKGVTNFVAGNEPEHFDEVLGNMANAATRLSPEVMLELLGASRQPGSDEAHVVAEITIRMSDPMIARFVARSVATERGCTARLAEAFRALAPDPERQQSIVSLAHDNAVNSALGAESDFESLWSRVAELLLSYSDRAWVSEAYNIELSAARARSLEVEHVPDDPPERIAGWLTTVSDTSLRSLDVQLLQDLLAVEADGERWQELLDVVVHHVDDLVLIGDFASARELVVALGQNEADGGTPVSGPIPMASTVPGVDPVQRRRAATAALELVVSGEMMAHVANHLNTIGDEDVEQVKALCLAIGTGLIPRLADTLASEGRPRSRQRLTDVLLAYGEHGRHCVDQLRRSPNPSVRRTAVQLLRTFGGEDALGDLADLLNDSEAHVRREAVRALIAIALDEAYQLLEQALASEDSRAREAVMQELSTTRDERATPLFCYMLHHLECRGKTREVYLKAVSRLGILGGPAAVEALTEVLHKGLWWAPMRAREWRSEAAAALAQINSPESRQALDAAATSGAFGVRRIARRYLGARTRY